MEKLTAKQMCEHIAKAEFLQYEGQPLAPAQIFTHAGSKYGELSKLFEWYKLACKILGGTYTEQNF